MGLSCGNYDDWDVEPGQWVYWIEEELDFIQLASSKRKRCCSCNKLIDIGSLCIQYPRRKYPQNEIEAKIRYNYQSLEDSLNCEPIIPMASHFHCERCGEIWLNLTSIGYEGLFPSENMIEALREYQELTAFYSKKK